MDHSEFEMKDCKYPSVGNLKISRYRSGFVYKIIDKLSIVQYNAGVEYIVPVSKFAEASFLTRDIST